MDKAWNELIAVCCLRAKQTSASLFAMDIDAYILILRERMAACSLTRGELASRTGGALSASWLSKFAAGHMSNPRADSLKALDAALSSCERQAA
jgi:hypothetical protein